MNILSLFDGMSCGQIALNRLGIKYDNYYASEIDKYAIKVTQHNYPNTIQLGDVTSVRGIDLPKIDILIGGSPCQSFSFAGKRKGMTTKDEIEILSLEHYLQLKKDGFEFEGQSYLFWEYMRIKQEVQPKYFLLENVEMGTKWEDVLNKAIGVRGVHINSALVSAQSRRRIYWTNIGLRPVGLFDDLESSIKQPIDKGILLKDVLEKDVSDKYFLSQKMIDCLTNHSAKKQSEGAGYKFEPTDGNKKAKILTTKAGGRADDNFIVVSRGEQNEQQLEPRNDGKTNCLTSVQKDNLVAIGLDIRENQLRYRDGGKTGTLLAKPNGGQFAHLNSGIRRLTPIECERLQTVPDNYTSIVSDTQRYKMLGNGWTIDVICHILKHIDL